jgi:hemerythrin-like domain-containing protein
VAYPVVYVRSDTEAALVPHDWWQVAAQRSLPEGDTMATRQPLDAIALLTAEHQQVRDLLQHYATTTDPDTQRQIASEVCTVFARHAQLEELVFYPAFAEVTDEEGHLLVTEAVAAHQAIQELMLEVQAPDVDIAVFEARFLGLRDTLEAHMAAEENALYPFAAEDLADRLESLRDEMVTRQQLLTTAPSNKPGSDRILPSSCAG